MENIIKDIAGSGKSFIVRQKLNTIPQLDKLVDGFFKGELINVFGAIGSGKTAFAVAIANELQKDKNVLFITTMTSEAHIVGIFDRANGVKTTYTKGISQFKGNLIIKHFYKKIDIKRFERFIKQIKKTKIDAIFIDDAISFTNVQPKDFMVGLREIASIFDCLVMVMSQGKRRSFGDLSDISGSAYLAQISDKVIFIDKLPEKKRTFWTKLMFWKKRINFIVKVLKNRTSSTNTAKGLFDFEKIKLKLYK